MSFAAAVTAIRATLAAGFTALPIKLPNEKARQADIAAGFVVLEVLGGENRIHTAGKPGERLFLHAGDILASIFTPSGAGADAGLAHADTIGALFQRTDIPAPTVPQIVRTEDPSVGAGEEGDENGRYFRVTVSIPFDHFYFA